LGVRYVFGHSTDFIKIACKILENYYIDYPDGQRVEPLPYHGGASEKNSFSNGMRMHSYEFERWFDGLTILSTPLLFFLAATVLFHCAKEGMPSGGPVDTTPPEVISVSPKPDSTRVDVNSKIEITFSERMSDKPTEESIFISPFPKKPSDSSWHKNKLIISLAEPLLKDKTYVVTVGTGAQDLRKNHLSKSYTFAFSTGAALDYGSISGTVWVKQKDASTSFSFAQDKSLTINEFRTQPGISIWAYLFSDTIGADPEKDKPDFVTQSDVAGKYLFKNLGVGKYRLFAVEDLNRDLVWDPDKEAIGVSTQDVELTSANISSEHVDFLLALVDTTKPSLLNCQASNRNQVRLDFDENLKAESVLNPDNFKIVSISTSESLKINDVYFSEGSRLAGQGNNTQNIFILTTEMNPQEKYELKVFNLEDESGNFLDTSANTCLFVGSSIFDTTGPKVISTSPKDGETGVPQDAEIKLIFDEPPNHPSVESFFSLSDSNGVLISGETGWKNPNTFIFSPDTLLLGKMKYQIKLKSQKILDLFGNAMTDSVWFLTFVTLNPDTLGSISGKVEASGESISGDIVLTLSLIDKGGKRYQKTLPQPGSFLFENILPGKYMVGAYVDLTKDGNLTIGNPKPFVLSEPFTFFPDTVTVRSRWETEGVELKFR
jgi:uncharacterized protein (DUF2141 family)